MLKKLFIAAILLANTVTANATPISINGLVDFFSVGTVTVDEMGSITQIDYAFTNVAYLEDTVKNGKNNDFFGEMSSGDLVTVQSPLVISTIEAISVANEALEEDDELNSLELWTVGGFSFAATEIIHNETENGFTGLSMLGMLSHEGHKDTLAQYFISATDLTIDGITTKAFSATVTSPAPISEPGTLAIFGLALVGFAASRKKKSA